MTKHFRNAILALGLGVLVAGCGFTPLYGEHGLSAAPEVSEALANVSIRSLPNREGVKLRQVLREELQPKGLVKPQYDLNVTLASRTEELGIRPDATSSRANLVMIATFTLGEGGQTVFGDRVQSIVSYNILDDQYATVAAQADAENRGIKEVGAEIKTRLAVYFHNRERAAAKLAPAAARQ